MTEYDYLIVGAGPGGLQMGYFLQQQGCRYAILERADAVAPFFRKLPRSRHLISFNKVHSIFDDPEIRLRWDWNSLLTEDYGFPFRDYSERFYPDADELVAYLEGFAEAYELPIRFGTTVTEVRRTDDDRFEVRDADGNGYRCRVLLIATGSSQPYRPDVPGLDDADDYEDVPVDPASFAGRRVLIIGKGNSALEIADVALETAALVHVASPRSLVLAYQSHHSGHARADYAKLIDAYHLKTLNSILDCEVLRVAKQPDGSFVVTVAYTHAEGEVDELVYDQVIRCTGFQFDVSFYDAACRPSSILDGRLPAITPYWESANVPGLFFVGELMQGRDFKRAASAFIHGFRYNVRTLFRHLMSRYEGEPLPWQTLPADPERLMRAVVERASRTSALWSQFRYLCDLFVVNDDGVVEWVEEVPFQALQEGEFSHHPHYYSLTFEWGQWGGDTMAVSRRPVPNAADQSVFLHPIVRRFAFGEAVSEHHLLEDLFGIFSSEHVRNAVLSHSGQGIKEYHRMAHEEPLTAFFADEFERVLTVPPARRAS